MIRNKSISSSSPSPKRLGKRTERKPVQERNAPFPTSSSSSGKQIPLFEVFRTREKRHEVSREYCRPTPRQSPRGARAVQKALALFHISCRQRESFLKGCVVFLQQLCVFGRYDVACVRRQFASIRGWGCQHHAQHSRGDKAFFHCIPPVWLPQRQNDCKKKIVSDYRQNKRIYGKWAPESYAAHRAMRNNGFGIRQGDNSYRFVTQMLLKILKTSGFLSRRWILQLQAAFHPHFFVGLQSQKQPKGPSNQHCGIRELNEVYIFYAQSGTLPYKTNRRDRNNESEINAVIP